MTSTPRLIALARNALFFCVPAADFARNNGFSVQAAEAIYQQARDTMIKFYQVRVENERKQDSKSPLIGRKLPPETRQKIANGVRAARLALKPRVCLYCKAVYKPNTQAQKYCTRACLALATRARYRQERMDEENG